MSLESAGGPPPRHRRPSAGPARIAALQDIEFRRLTEVSLDDLVALFNHPEVRRHLPLARGRFTRETCARFVDEKERMWATHGFGPWAFVAEGEFVGWGGIQPLGGDADLALVLHPRFWGLGYRLVEEILRRSAAVTDRFSLIILLPSSRSRVRALHRLGFERDGQTLIEGVPFIRFRSRGPTGPG